MKIKGDELKRFMVDGWPKPDDDWYWDQDIFEEPDPHETYDTDDIGPLVYQGSDPELFRETLDLGALIRKWRKARDFDMFTIEVKKDQVPAVRAALAAVGIKI